MKKQLTLKKDMTPEQWRKEAFKSVTEKQLQRQVTEAAKLYGWRIYHTYDSRRSQKGFPDLILVKPPLMFALELKTEDGKLTDDQFDWLYDFRNVKNVTAGTIRPHDFDWFVDKLKAFSNKEGRKK